MSVAMTSTVHARGRRLRKPEPSWAKPSTRRPHASTLKRDVTAGERHGLHRVTVCSLAFLKAASAVVRTRCLRTATTISGDARGRALRCRFAVLCVYARCRCRMLLLLHLRCCMLLLHRCGLALLFHLRRGLLGSERLLPLLFRLLHLLPLHLRPLLVLLPR